MTTTLKNLIYEETKQLFQKLHGDFSAAKQAQACLYWARCGIMTLIEHGFTPCLQAGTLMVRTIPQYLDDGKRDLFFGFKWEPDSPASRIQTLKGLLPEIHCWLGLTQEQELIDFSTGTLAQAARNAGQEWLMPEPPPFIWCNPRDVPDQWFYEPNREATLCAMEFLLKANCVEELKQEERIIEV